MTALNFVHWKELSRHFCCFPARTTQKSFFLNYTRGGNIALNFFILTDVKAYFSFLKSYIKQDESSVNLCMGFFFNDKTKYIDQVDFQ